MLLCWQLPFPLLVNGCCHNEIERRGCDTFLQYVVSSPVYRGLYPSARFDSVVILFIMVPPLDTSSLWKKLSMREIIGLLPCRTFSAKEKHSHANLDRAVLQLPPDRLAILEHAALSKTLSSDNAVDPELYERHSSPSDFFETVSEECRRDRICKFIDATGNKATATVSCAVCAGNFFKIETKEWKLSHLPNHLLAPCKTHPAQTVTEGMILDTSPSSMRTDEDGLAFVNVCQSCTSDIQKKKTPALSLANGLWIGDVPLELSVLTLPERILVARYFPAAHIVKLYPKKRGFRYWSDDGLHHALRGNVTTYPLNTNQIACLASGLVLPPSPTILATTIGVTFIGPKNLPQRNLPPFLRVNRTRMRVALEWLKVNNPLYANIGISQDNLDALPANGIPREILSLVKYSEDTRLLAEEMDGYVPSDCVDEGGEFEGKCFHCVNILSPLPNTYHSRRLRMGGR
jgi:hypothetical protein